MLAPKPMRHCYATIVGNRPVSEGYYELTIEWPRRAARPEPGQFLTLRVSPDPVPLLRRPFAFSGFDEGGSDGAPGHARILYERRGRATRALTAATPGETLDILAPLGNRFPEPGAGRRPVLIAGGVGMGPIFYWAERLAGSGAEIRLAADTGSRAGGDGTRNAGGSRNTTGTAGRAGGDGTGAGKPPVLAVGAQRGAIVPTELLPEGPELVLASDDGSLGTHGTVMDALGPLLAEEDQVELYACGPMPMLRAAHEAAERLGAPLWVSMEQTMGCAVGACMGCTVRVNDERVYARVCTEGPVFPSTEIDWASAPENA